MDLNDFEGLISSSCKKVISAIFLKDTLDAAQNDAEQLVADRLRKKAQYVRKLEEVRNVIC